MSAKEIRLELEEVNHLAEIVRRVLVNDPFDLRALIDYLQENRLPYTYLIETTESPNRRLTQRDLIIIGTFCDLTANGNRDPEVASSMKSAMGIIFPEGEDQIPQVVALKPEAIEQLLTSCRFAGSSDGSKVVYGWL